jgi:glucan phosphoethanolaminetransferase (alkaline phosphatase superfamily)
LELSNDSFDAGRERPGYRSGRSKVAIAAKVVAAFFLLLGTVGLLWHNTFSSGHLVGGEANPIFAALHGWFPIFLGTLYHAQSTSMAGLAAYLSVCIAICAAYFATPFVRNTPLRIIASIILFVGVSYDLIMYDIIGDLPSKEITETVISNALFGLDGTTSAYTENIIRNLCLTIPALVAFVLPPPRLGPILQRMVTGIVVFAFVGVGAILWKSHGNVNAFPSPIRSYISAYAELTRKESSTVPSIQYPGEPRSTLRKIVLVMDESVRGDYLSLNTPSAGTTPYLVANRGEIANFGEASSATNCSVESRLTVRFGLLEKQLQPDLRSMTDSLPTIWQYAQRGGFKTVYIDTFGRSGLSPSNMLQKEHKFIDETIYVPNIPYFERDRVVAAKLRDLLQDPAPMFIIADKYGTHVPYDRMYPPERNLFGADASRPFSLSDKDELVKHYKNALSWSVDALFESVLAGGLSPDTLLLYTSDHGQSLSETPTRVSHCSSARFAVKGEGIVPLFALSSDGKWQQAVLNAAGMNFNRSSHFEIFPTLLLALGYEPSWIRARFGDTLLEKVPAERQRAFWADGQMRKID